MLNSFKKSQKGSVFTVLLAGVAMAGTLSVILYQVISGPMASVVRVSNKTAAKNQLQSISNIVIMDAINLTANGGDCDNDGYVEPREWRVPLNGANSPQGGGLIPNDIGAPLSDPWGSDYGYCVWDIGTANDPSVEVVGGACGAPSRRLSGTPDPTDSITYGGAETQTVLAIISAGPDRQFDNGTECRNYIDKDTSVLTLGGDDFIQRYTYNEAATATSSLWKIKTNDPTFAEIDKNISVGEIDETTGKYKEDGESGIIRALAVITQGMIQAGGPLRLADEAAVDDTQCNTGNEGDVRYNARKESIEVCNGSEWRASSAGGFMEGAVPFANNEGDLTQDIDDKGTPADTSDDEPTLSWDNINKQLSAINIRSDNDVTVGNMVLFEGDTGAEPAMANPMIGDLSDVDITSPTDGQVLTYDGTSGGWQNKNAAAPIGSMVMYAGSSAPTGWLLCQGQAISRTTYPALFSAIGTSYGAGDGSNTFNLPDMRGAAPAGAGTSSGYTQNETIALGLKYNDITQSHEHSIDPPSTTSGAGSSHSHSADPPNTAVSVTNKQSDNTTATSHAHSATLSGSYLGRNNDNTGSSAWGAEMFLYSAHDRWSSGGVSVSGTTASAGSHTHYATVNIASFTSGAESAHNHTLNISAFDSSTPKTDDTNGTPRTGNSTRGKRVGVNFIIKY